MESVQEGTKNVRKKSEEIENEINILYIELLDCNQKTNQLKP